MGVGRNHKENFYELAKVQKFVDHTTFEQLETTIHSKFNVFSYNLSETLTSLYSQNCFCTCWLVGFFWLFVCDWE